jgi:hypothetical protein
MAPENTGPIVGDEEAEGREKARRPADKPQAKSGDGPPGGEQAATDAAKRPDIAKHLSDSHLGPRWQIARFKFDHPDPFCKDIYFGARKVTDPATAQADKREIEFKNKVEQTIGTLKAIYRPPEPDNPEDDGFWRRTWKSVRPQQAPHNDQWYAARATRFNEAYDRLYSLTVLGLATDVDLAIADAALNSLRADVVRREAGPIKNAYMRKLGRPAMAAGIILILLFLLYDKSPGFFATICDSNWGLVRLACDPVVGKEYRALFPNEMYEYRAIFLLLAGCMMGTWASFAARKVTLVFSDLAELEQDALAPRMRLVFTGVLTFILSLVFLTGLVQIEIGGFSTKRLVSDGLVAILIGAFFGLLEQALPAAVMDRARGFVETVNAK